MSIRRDGYRKKIEIDYEKLINRLPWIFIIIGIIGLIIGIHLFINYAETNNEESSFVLVEHNVSQDLMIYYHKDTKVMYVKTCGFSPCIEVMVDADGKPLLYDGDDEGD